jgi:signal-transduction protein with cAMP-binding, CBS, and nucleotidyltransferase domain
MTRHQVWACPETSDAQEVAAMMRDHNVGAIPVLDHMGRLEGIVTDRDLCCKLIAEGRPMDTPIYELMSEPAYSVSPATSLLEIESMMRRFRIRRLPVVDEAQALMGFISISDIAAHCDTIEAEHDFVGVMETVSVVAGRH